MKLTVEQLTSLSEHQCRVVGEKNELDGKIDRLTSFISSDMFNTLPSEDRVRMAKQAIAMVEYSSILGDRIFSFVK